MSGLLNQSHMTWILAILKVLPVTVHFNFVSMATPGLLTAFFTAADVESSKPQPSISYKNTESDNDSVSQIILCNMHMYHSYYNVQEISL